MTSRTCPCPPELARDRRVRRCVAAGLFAAVLVGPISVAAPADLVPALSTTASPFRIKDGRLTVEVRDADLAQLLGQIAERAGFQLVTSGSLGRVTVTLSAVSLDKGLRRLVQDHELMLVYRRGEREGAPMLVQVRVFAAGSGRGALAGAPEGDGASHSASVAEINNLVRTRDTEQGVPRLADLLTGAPDARIRARAAWALGRLGGGTALDLLYGALRDQAVDVRIQAVQALRHVAGVQAIPALGALLLNDPDASVRRAVAGALATLREPQAVSALTAAAGDPDPSVRDEVKGALARQGSGNP